MAKKKEAAEQNIQAVEEALGRTEQFIERNKNILSYVIIGLIVVIGGYIGYMKFVKSPKEREAQANIFMAEHYFEIDSLDLAINGDENFPGFLEIAEDYGFTNNGNLAKYYLGICYLKKGEFDLAIDYLEDFDASNEAVGPMAIGAIGDCYMELGDQESALDHYLKAADQSDNLFTAPVFLKKAGQTYELLGDYASAAEVYERIQKEYWGSTESREVEKYLARAQAKAGIE